MPTTGTVQRGHGTKAVRDSRNTVTRLAVGLRDACMIADIVRECRSARVQDRISRVSVAAVFVPLISLFGGTRDSNPRDDSRAPWVGGSHPGV